ncbi:putative Ig domain-containing protein [Hydrogenophaga sp.]|uniref:putative Ig domain-containing protein n=1 Tax=Hydrogenophaga sp. TaxID=1904254 RepID=UPI003D0E69AA
MPAEISAYLKYANLQMAAESLFGLPRSALPGVVSTEMTLQSLTLGNERASLFTAPQAQQLIDDHWTVVEHKSNTETGFSGTLFRNSQTGEQVLSFRSTEFADDAMRDNQATNTMEIKGHGWAFGQIADMQAWFESLQARNLVSAPLTVTGYSLGGHLATAFNLLYPSAVTATYTYNGAGVGLVDEGQNLTQVMQAFAERKATGANSSAFTDDQVLALYQTCSVRYSSGSEFTNWSDRLQQLQVDKAAALSLIVEGRPQASWLYEALQRVEIMTEEAQRIAAGIDSGSDADGAKIIETQHIAALGLDYQLAVLHAAQFTEATRTVFDESGVVAYGQHEIAPNPIANFFDVFGAPEPSGVAYSQIHYGEPVGIWIEDQPLLRGDVISEVVEASGLGTISADFKLLVDDFSINDFGDTHSLVLLIDSLSVQGTFAHLQSNISIEALSGVFHAADNKRAFTDVALNLTPGNQGLADGNSLERIVNLLAAQLGVAGDSLSGNPNGNTWHEVDPVDSYSGRETLHERLAAINQRIADLDLAGRVSVVQTGTASASTARLSFGDFLALHQLSPFALRGEDSAAQAELDSMWQSTQSDLYLAWQADRNAYLYGDADHEYTYSDQWIADRATLLQALNSRNQQNNDTGQVFDPQAPNGHATVLHFVDPVSDEAQTLITRSAGGTVLPDQHVLFGGDGADSFPGFDNVRPDHLYGGAGNDTLSGVGGADHLEGGSGDDVLDGGAGNDTLLGGTGVDTLTGGANNDTLQGGAGTDTYIIDGSVGNDTILDEDGGVIRYLNHVLSGGQETGPGAQEWKDQHATYRLITDGTQEHLLISVGAGTVTIRDWTPGHFGIQLQGHQAPTPVTPQTNIAGDLAPLDQDPQANGVQMAYDALGNVIVNAGQAEPNRADTLYDSAADDELRGYGGDDTLDAFRGGHDLLDGGTGDDYLMAGEGDDTLVGGEGLDRLLGQAGDDKLFAEIEQSDEQVVADHTAATEDDDGISGQGDILAGGAGDDWQVGGRRADVLLGGEGQDTLWGGAGDDFIRGDANATAVGVGWQFSRWVSGTHVYNHSLTNVGYESPSVSVGEADNLYGGAGNDWLFGDGGQDKLYGGSGDDVLFGGSGSDWLEGGEGDDVLLGDNGNGGSDGHGHDWIDGGAGNDTMWGDAGHDVLLGGDGDDYLSGATGEPVAVHGDDFLDGGAGNDTLYGYGGKDSLWGGAGHDLIDGGNGVAGITDGDDELHGEDGNDTMFGNAGHDTLHGGADNDLMFGDGEATTALDGNDWLDGGAGNDSLFGGGGNDTLSGGEGDDAFLGGEGNDALYGGLGNDQMWGEAGNDWLAGDAGDDHLAGEDGNDTLVGGEGQDALLGGAGNDELHLDGQDFADGGAGDDTYVIDGGAATSASGLVSLIQDHEGENRILLRDGTTISTEGLQVFSQNGQIFATFGGGSLIALTDAATLEHLHIETINEADPQAAGTMVNMQSVVERDDADGRIRSGVWADGEILRTSDIQVAQVLAGTRAADLLEGGSHNDVLDGHAGEDELRGGAGQDVLSGGAGSNTLMGGLGNDALYVGAADEGDAVTTDTVAFNLGDGLDRLQLTEGADVSQRGLVLVFGEGIGLADLNLDLLHGSGGAEHWLTLQPGQGMVLAPGLAELIQELRFSDGTSMDRAAWVDWLQSRQFDGDATGGSDAYSDQTLNGTANNDRLLGGYGNDTVRGGLGDDVLEGSGGSNRYIFGRDDGDDTVLVHDSELGELAFIDADMAGLSATWHQGGILVRQDASNSVMLHSASGKTQALLDMRVVDRNGQQLLVSELIDAPSPEVPGSLQARRDAFLDVQLAQLGSLGQRYQGPNTWGAAALATPDSVEVLATTMTEGQVHEHGSYLRTSTRSEDREIVERTPVFETINHPGTTQVQRVFVPINSGVAYDGVLIAGSEENVLSATGQLVGYWASFVGTQTPPSVETRQVGWTTTTRIETVTHAQDSAVQERIVGTQGDDVVRPDLAQMQVSIDQYGNETSYPVLFRGSVETGEGNDQILLGSSSNGGGGWTSDWSIERDWGYLDLTHYSGQVSDHYFRGLGAWVDAGEGDDTVMGTDGNDVIIGGAGADFLDGQAGADTYVIGFEESVVDRIQDLARFIPLPEHDWAAAQWFESYGGDLSRQNSDVVEFDASIELPRLTYRIIDENVDDGTSVYDKSVVLQLFHDGTFFLEALIPLADAVSGVSLPGIELFRFADGSEYQTAALLQLLAQQPAPPDLQLSGTAADDSLVGGLGADTLDGGLGADTLMGGFGNDTYVVDDAGDVVIEHAWQGTDTVQAHVSHTLSANVENLTLLGTAHIDGTGNAQNNVLIGNAGNNLLDGAAGADRMEGGLGDDTYVVDDYEDEVVEHAGEGNDMVLSGTSFALGDNLEGLTLTGSEGLSGQGNALNNLLIGNAGDNYLMGDAGDDTLLGGAGEDYLHGGDGSDHLDGGAGADVYALDAADPGWDTIYDGTAMTDEVDPLSAVVDTVRFGSGVTPQALQMAWTVVDTDDGQQLALSISWGGAGGAHVVVPDSDAPQGVGVERFEFSNGTVWTLQQMLDIAPPRPAEEPTVTVAQAIGAVVALEDDAWSFQIPGTAFDVEGDLVPTYELRLGDGSTPLPSWLQFDPVTGTLSGSPGNEDVGVLDLQITAVLNETQSATQQFTLEVHNTNDAPELSALVDVQVTVGQPLTWSLSAAAVQDVDVGDSHSVMVETADASPLPAWLTFDPVTGELSGQPGGGDTGQLTLRVTVTDSAGATAERLFTLHVNPEQEGIHGTAFDDEMVGSMGNDVMYGGDGNDTFYALDGDDVIYGGDGNDFMEGGAGRDTLVGGAGDDTYWAIEPDDVIVEHEGGGHDRVIIFGDGGTLDVAQFDDQIEAVTAVGFDTVVGTTGGDEIEVFSDEGGTVVEAGLGDDTLGGESQYDVLRGGEGSDLIRAAGTMDGGAGNDTLMAQALGPDGVTHTVMLGSAGDDWIYSMANAGSTAWIEGGIGNDFIALSAFASNTVVYRAGDGIDSVYVHDEDGDDTLLFPDIELEDLAFVRNDDSLGIIHRSEPEASTVWVEGFFLSDGPEGYYSFSRYVFGEDEVELTVQGMIDRLQVFTNGGGIGDQLAGGTGDDVLYGRDGNDTINGLGGNDVIVAGNGNDMLDGGSGDDTLVGGSGNDTILFGRGGGADLVTGGSETWLSDQDIVQFGADVAREQLWFEQVGNDLRVSIIGTTDSITVPRWYPQGSQAQDEHRIDEFRTMGGEALIKSQVDSLVSAMAAFSPPPMGQFTLDQQRADALGTQIAASWQ